MTPKPDEPLGNKSHDTLAEALAEAHKRHSQAVPLAVMPEFFVVPLVISSFVGCIPNHESIASIISAEPDSMITVYPI